MVSWNAVLHRHTCLNPHAKVQAVVKAHKPFHRRLVSTSIEKMASIQAGGAAVQRQRVLKRQEKALARLRGKSTSGTSSDTSSDASAYVDPAELREVIGRYINLVEGDTELELLQHHAVAYVRGDEGSHKSLMKFVKPLLARR